MARVRVSLRARLLSGFLAIAAIGLAGSALGLAALASVGRAAQAQYERATLPAADLTRVSLVFQRMATGVRDEIIADNAADLVRASTFMSALKGDMDGAVADYLGGAISSEARRSFEAFQVKLAKYQESIDALSDKAQRGDRAGAMVSLKDLKGQAVGLQTAIDGMQAGMDAYAASEAASAARRVAGATVSFVASTALSLALSVLLGLAMARSIGMPIGRMRALAATIADGDLTGELGREALARSDEIGGLASAIDSMKTGILGNIGNIKVATTSLDAMGRILERNALEASEAATAIAASVASVKGKVIDQGAGVTETSATIDQIQRSIAALDAQIADQSGSVTRSSSAIEQMVANIRAVTSSVESLGSSFVELGKASDAGSRMLADMSSRISSISSQSEKLDEANGIVSNIATQTDLLAMNAAIEAAHAGAAGKGFAVVADEIRKLAESASDQSKEISSDIGEIKETIRSMVPSSVETSKAFAEILRLIATLGTMEAEIKRAMLEQSQGSREILGAIERIESSAASVRRGSAEIRDGSTAIAAEMKELMGGSSALGAAMEDIERVAASVEGVSIGMRSISAQASSQVRALVEGLDCYTLPEACIELESVPDGPEA